MDLFEKLYDEHENVKVRFVGFTTELTRYDFGIVFTNLFFGKPLVVCMQTG
ncbi:SAV0927 family protein, partial [Bacillus sp. JJ1503]